MGGSYRAMQSYAVMSGAAVDVRGVREVRVSVQFLMLVAKKSLHETRNNDKSPRSRRLPCSKLIRSESINKKLNVT